MTIVYKPHVCDTPPRYSTTTLGTIWHCDDCDRYRRLRRVPHSLSRYEWKLIQPWHLVSVLRLLRAESHTREEPTR